MKRRITAAAAIIFTITAPTAFAQSPSAPAPSSVAADSQPQTARKLFLALDRNHDGNVSRDELSALVHRSVTRRVYVRVAQLDRNKDGRISREEVRQMQDDRFARLDVDHDGFITAGEMTTVMVRQATSRIKALFASLDTDKDGSCCAEELLAYQRRIDAQQARGATQVAEADQSAGSARN